LPIKILHLLLPLWFADITVWSTTLSADEANHRQAAEQLLELITIQEKVDSSHATMLNLQQQQERTPRDRVELLHAS
jgi:hypothetical protein